MEERGIKMSYISEEDGQIHASAGEQYHYSGWVTVKVYVDFDSPYEEGEAGYDNDLNEALVYMESWEVENADELECEIMEIEDD